MGKILFILGGARSGKSAFAEGMAAEYGKKGAFVLYLATCARRRDDGEMERRILSHQARRPDAWKTMEEPEDPGRRIGEMPDNSVVLVDCLSLWVSGLLMASPEEGNAAVERVLGKVREFFQGAAKALCDVIVVSSEVGAGVVPPSPLGRLYRDVLGLANQEGAKAADEVWFVVAGLPRRLK